MKKLCIWHGGCTDGFGAAWAVWKALGDDVEFHPGDYKKGPPDVTDRQVVIVDFSYKRPVLEEMAKTAQSILVLDHHKSAEKELGDYPHPAFATVGPLPASGVYAEFDMNRSGAMMTWNHFHANNTAPELIRYIQDRDLWRKELPGVDEVIEALRAYPLQFEIWDKFIGLGRDGVSRLQTEGTSIMRYYRAKIEQVKRNAHMVLIDGVEVPVCNAPYFMASDLAGELAEGNPFAAVYWDTPDGRTYSLRSREGGADVLEIAEKFGGGGHARAAGCALVHGESITHST